MLYCFTNNPVSILAASVAPGDVEVQLRAGDGEKFPVITGASDTFVITLEAQGVMEIMRVTGRVVDVLQVERGYEGTTAASFVAGVPVQSRVTRKVLENFVQKDGDTIDGVLTVGATGRINWVSDSVSGAAQESILTFDVTQANNNNNYGEALTLIRAFDSTGAVVELNQYGGLGLGMAAPVNEWGLNVGGPLKVGKGTGAGNITTDRASGNVGGYELRTAGVRRYGLLLQGIESGAEGNGSDLKFYRYSNAGVQLGIALTLARADGAATFEAGVDATALRARTAKTPASATAAGNVGEICWDSGYVYVCVATNTWKRAALASW